LRRRLRVADHRSGPDPVCAGDAAGYAFGFFLLIYAGLSLGVARYRLFDLSEWAFRIGFYTGGTLLLFAIDAALILLLQLQQTTSLGIALLLVGSGISAARFIVEPLHSE
jgi:hypothetical protein